MAVAVHAPQTPAAPSSSGNPLFKPTLVTVTADASYANDEASTSLEWMNRVQLPSLRGLPAEALKFETKPAVQDPSVIRSQRPLQTQVELTAFQFQK